MTAPPVTDPTEEWARSLIDPANRADDLARLLRPTAQAGTAPAGADFLPVIAVLLVALLDRLDAFAAVLAGVAEDMKGATSGGLLGLLTGGRR